MTNKFYIFKSPYKAGSAPLETLMYEPNDFIIGQKSVKYGSIIVMDDAAIAEWKKQHAKG